MHEGKLSVVVDKEKSGLRAAVLNGGVVQSFYFSSENICAGDFYLGKVRKSHLGEMGWFLDLGCGKRGFLPHDKTLSEAPVPGDLRLVQIEKEERDGKSAQLTEKVQVVSRGVIYLPSGSYVAVSHQIEEPEREVLRKRAMDWCIAPEGAIIRTFAARMNTEQIAAEFENGRFQWERIKKEAESMDHPGVIFRPFSFIESILNENHNPSGCTIYSNINLGEAFLSGGVEIVYQYQADLFALHELNGAYTSAMQPDVLLPGGAALVIDYAEALTAIDVNSGSAPTGTNWNETALEINLHAAREIARQLRLREIGGMIVIDFLRLSDPLYEQEVLNALMDAVSDDPATIKLFGYTKMGLVELTRKRRRAGLKDRVLARRKQDNGIDS